MELHSHAELDTEFHSHAWPGTELHPHTGADTELHSHAGLHTELHSHAGTDTSARLTVEIGCSVVRKQASLPVRLVELFCCVLPVLTCSPARPAVELRCSMVRDLLTRQACHGAVSQTVCGVPLFAQRSGRLWKAANLGMVS